MNAEQIAIIKSSLSNVSKVVAEFEAELKPTEGFSMMDGSPFLTLITEASGNVRVFGEWDGVVGFKTAELIPAHLCGCILSSQESADRKIAKLNSPDYGTLREGDKASYMHRQDFLKVMLAKYQAVKENLEKALAISEAHQEVNKMPEVEIWKTLPSAMRSQGWVKAGFTTDTSMLKEIKRDLQKAGNKVAFSRGALDNVIYWTKKA